MLKAIVKAFICLLMSMPVIAQTSIYPTNWWVGMKDPSLQLMVHKKDIGTATVKMSPYTGVSLVKTYVPENKNYVFIDLTIAPSAKPGKLNFTIQQGKKNESFSFELKRKDPSNGHARIKGVNSS
ncbi:MAG TPA: cyclomaltodextrinase N-terminal domain-containing protein, partial [Chitinophagaceae bacterium]|nr:cyclomaltodextrinase N-terminal domain-containing protein [Chitinophagaceae bacterium]